MTITVSCACGITPSDSRKTCDSRDIASGIRRVGPPNRWLEPSVRQTSAKPEQGTIGEPKKLATEVTSAIRRHVAKLDQFNASTEPVLSVGFGAAPRDAPMK